MLWPDRHGCNRELLRRSELVCSCRHVCICTSLCTSWTLTSCHSITPACLLPLTSKTGTQAALSMPVSFTLASLQASIWISGLAIHFSVVSDPPEHRVCCTSGILDQNKSCCVLGSRDLLWDAASPSRYWGDLGKEDLDASTRSLLQFPWVSSVLQDFKPPHLMAKFDDSRQRWCCSAALAHAAHPMVIQHDRVS